MTWLIFKKDSLLQMSTHSAIPPSLPPRLMCSTCAPCDRSFQHLWGVRAQRPCLLCKLLRAGMEHQDCPPGIHRMGQKQQIAYGIKQGDVRGVRVLCRCAGSPCTLPFLCATAVFARQENALSDNMTTSQKRTSSLSHACLPLWIHTAHHLHTLLQTTINASAT